METDSSSLSSIIVIVGSLILYAVVTLFQASITSLMRWGQLERIVSADADLSSTRTYLNSNPNTPVGIFSVVRFLAASTLSLIHI